MKPRTDQHRLVRRVAEFVRRKRLIEPNARVLVAVSGGPDSVCLLNVLHAIRKHGEVPGLELHIAHVNYGLRGEESEGDEAYVRELAERLNIPISCERVALRRRSGRTIQSAAREARYAVFERLLKEFRLTSVATGHTADDQAETVLMWLVRGTGTKGLAGIPVKREGAVIRPLLGATREEVLNYLEAHGIVYRSDSSNEKPLYRRNRIRKELLPLLRAFNPRIVEGLARDAEIFYAEDALLEELTDAQWKVVVKEQTARRVVFDYERMASLPLAIQRRLVRRGLSLLHGRATGVTFHHVSKVLEQVVEGEQGARLDLPDRIHVKREGAGLAIMRLDAPKSREEMLWTAGLPLPVPGSVRIETAGRRIVAATGTSAKKGRAHFVADAARLGGPLIVRNWRHGDWFCPMGMAGHRKKLQDFFVDCKVPRNDRDAVPLVVAPAGIVWVVGYRGDERFAAGPGISESVTLSVVKDEA